MPPGVLSSAVAVGMWPTRPSCPQPLRSPFLQARPTLGCDSRAPDEGVGRCRIPSTKRCRGEKLLRQVARTVALMVGPVHSSRSAGRRGCWSGWACGCAEDGSGRSLLAAAICRSPPRFLARLAPWRGCGKMRLAGPRVENNLSMVASKDRHGWLAYRRRPSIQAPKSAIRFLFTQTLPAGRGIFSPFCVSERAPPVRYALRRQFRSHPQAFWGVLAAAPPLTPSSWRQRRRECRTRDHDVSGMTHPSCMKRTQRSRIAVNTASMAELIFKNVCLPCRTILPAV